MNEDSPNSISVTKEKAVDLDFRLEEEFHLGAKKFGNNPLHQKFQNGGDIRELLQFVPRMLFFVMGFKDLMQLVRYKNPKNKLEESVNIHSDEDSYHWKWFLDDLTFISGKFNNFTSSDLIAEVWKDETLEVRQTIYLFSRYVQRFQDPVARMLMIEVLEITFDEFKEALHPVLKEAGLYNQLDYFGLKHQETEENHSTGTSDDEIAGLIENLDSSLKEEMLTVLPILFDQMYRMAKNWAEA